MKKCSKSRISNLYKSLPARASNPQLARHSQTSARASTLPLERRIHTPRTFTEPGLRSSINPPRSSVTQPPARASQLPFERTTLQRRYWKMESYARASKTPLERTDDNEGPARASNSPLEREGQNLGNYSWFLSPTNL